MKHPIRTLSMLALCATGSACHSDKLAGPQATLAAAPVPSGAVQPSIQQIQEADGSYTFVVRVASNGVVVSAYQGTVTFEPGAFELVSATAPQGADGESHILNSADVASGRIRFAAFTTTSFAGTEGADGMEALRFTVRSSRSVASANVAATLDVVGKEAGLAMPPSMLIRSAGVRNVAGRLIQ